MEAAGTSSDEYSHFFHVKLECFDGPIDLLLHLVKQNELPIEKLSLAEVCGQYLACLEAMRQFDLEIAGEYLVIAATLVSIKSSVLLSEPGDFGIDLEDGGIDPHEELLRRLREAAVYKDCAEKLSQHDLLNFDVFAPPSLLKEIEPPPAEFVDHDPMLLGKAFRAILDELGDEETYHVSVDSVSIVQRMMEVLEVLKGSGGTSTFRELIPDLRSKASIIATFISLLELCKRQVIHVRQESETAEIVIVLVTESTEAIEMESEFDDDTEVAAND